MKLRRYRKQDYWNLNALCHFRGCYFPPEDEMPKLGWLAIDEKRVVAMAFLRKVEGGYAILDGVITNPLIDGTVRHQALDALFAKAMEEGRKRGFKAILGTSTDVSTIMRSEKFGFEKLPHAYLVATLAK